MLLPRLRPNQRSLRKETRDQCSHRARKELTEIITARLELSEMEIMQTGQ